jgi:hypothetical protein
MLSMLRQRGVQKLFLPADGRVGGFFRIGELSEGHTVLIGKEAILGHFLISWC